MSDPSDPIPTATADSAIRLESIGAEVRIGVHLDVAAFRTPVAPLASVQPNEPGPGSIVAGRYELVRLLGRGSMGAVWLANHRTLREEVAVKLLAPAHNVGGMENDSTTTARFRFEAQVAARLSRKTRHIVRVTDHGQDGPFAFLVMERLEGQTLEGALANRVPMSVDEVSWIVTQIARGLEVAHAEGILHRDLKPSNIFLARGEEGPLVKLLDFGIARGDPSSPGTTNRFATANGLLFGTPGYMSPEQACASQPLDSRADLWALASIAYEALTGSLPVIGVSTEQMLANVRAARVVPIRRRNPGLSAACERFFERAFAPKIEDRYSSCSELAAAFVAVVEPAGKRRRIRWQLKASSAIVGVALAGAAVWCAWAGVPRRGHGLPLVAAHPVATGGTHDASIVTPTLGNVSAPSVPRTPTGAATTSAPPIGDLAPSKKHASGAGSTESGANGDLGEFKAYF